MQGGAIMVSLRGSPVLRYNTAVVKPPPGIDAVYRRSGHIHPVYSRRAEFAVELRHSDLSAPGGAKPVLKEIWRVRTWNVAEGHLFDLESRQTCIADSRWS